MRDSERSLREAQSIAHIGSFEFDLRTRRASWSDEIFNLYDLDRTSFDPSSGSLLDRVHAQDRERVRATYLKSIRSREPYQITYRITM